jgi:hypothetical protein
MSPSSVFNQGATAGVVVREEELGIFRFTIWEKKEGFRALVKVKRD